MISLNYSCLPLIGDPRGIPRPPPAACHGCYRPLGGARSLQGLYDSRGINSAAPRHQAGKPGGARMVTSDLLNAHFAH